MNVYNRTSGMWSATLEPGIHEPWDVEENLIITNVALDPNFSDYGRSKLAVACRNVGSQEFQTSTIAVLTPAIHVEHLKTSFDLTKGQTIAFQVLGENTIHAIGYYTIATIVQDDISVFGNLTTPTTSAFTFASPAARLNTGVHAQSISGQRPAAQNTHSTTASKGKRKAQIPRS